MADGMILRGEVYWVSVDDSVGAEIQTGRPAVIISGNRSNETSPVVLVAFITSQGHPHPHNVSVKVNGEHRRVLCDHIRTISKERLTRHIGMLANHEMIRITGALATAMCIPIRGPETTQNEQESKEITSLKAECEMWKRCYDVAMTQLVDLKVNSDLALRMARAGYDYEETEEFEEEVPVEEPVEEPVKVPEPVVEEEQKQVEVNTCTAEELKKCGCNPVVVENILNHRPYKELDDLRKVPGVTSVAFGILKHKLCCIPVKVEEPEVVVQPEPEVPEVVEPEKTPEIEETVPEAVIGGAAVGEKVNINTASAKEIMEKLGTVAAYAYYITGYRNKNGNFVDLKELLDVKHLPKSWYEKYKDQLTLGGEEPKADVAKTGTPPEEPKQPEPPKEEEAPKKLNINTASTRELMEVGFSKSAAAKIVNTRKKYGKFRTLDDLVYQEDVSGKTLRKLRDKLEV